MYFKPTAFISLVVAIATVFFGSTDASMGANVIINGSFEIPVIGGTNVVLLNESLVPGWETTAPDDLIELWSSTAKTATQSVKDAALAHFKEDLEAAALTWIDNRAKSKKYAAVALELAEFEDAVK